MGDMGDLYRAWDEYKSVRRVDKALKALEVIDDVRATVDSLVVDPSGTWNIVQGKHKIQFYPTKGSWQYRNKMYHGGIDSFRGWLSKINTSGD